MRPSQWFSRGLIVMVAFVSLAGVARLGQKGYDSLSFGERAPYLQQVGSNRALVRWRTSEPVRGTVHLGSQPGQWERSVSEPAAVTDHRVVLDGLSPGSRFYYAVGDEGDGKGRWGGEAYQFHTAPATGEEVALRLWVVGDPGYDNAVQRGVLAAARDFLARNVRPGRPPLDLFLTTGDNAYSSGRAGEFDRHFFRPFAPELRTVGAWPAYGNHDARRWAFFDLFDLPAAGESGGVPSGTEHYYAFDYGPLHAVVLDTTDSDLSRDGAMAKWLRTDLAASRQPWRIAVFHHPPYTRGGHNSDKRTDSGGRMAAVRQNLLPLLEAGGVDLVLTGHSHNYERSALIACHYGPGTSFESSMVVDAESPYLKSTAMTGPAGTVYAVVGATAKRDRGPLDHPANVLALSQTGSLIVDIETDRLTARYVDDKGAVVDEFVIEKSVHAPPPAVSCTDGPAG